MLYVLDGEAIGNPLVEGVAQAVQERTPETTFFFLNIGDEPNLEENFERLQQLFVSENAGSFVGHAEREAGATHMSTRLVGLHDGLTRLFSETWPITNESLVTNGVAALEEHLAALSSRFGYPVLYNAQSYQRATQMLLSRQDVEGATASARLYVMQYSKSPVAHFLLGSALASGGARDEALRAIDTAIELYEQDPASELAPLYETMKSVRQRLVG